MLLERDRELRVLRNCIQEAAKGRSGLAIVEGPPGVGKTSLLEVAKKYAAQRGLLVLAARGRELERAIPGAVVQQLLAPALLRAGARGRARLLRGLPRLLAPLLDGAPLGLELGGEDPAVAVTLALASLFERVLAQGTPAAIVVDDVQWADSASLRLLAHLLLDREEPAFGLLVALRMEGSPPPSLHALRASSRARLLRPAPLSHNAVRRLVRARLAAAEPEFCDLCARETAGNPFLLGALLRSLREDGVSGSAADAARLESFVPDSVLSAVLVRLARCSVSAARLARATSVLGEATLRQAAALAGLDSLTADAAADELAGFGFTASGEPLAFAHPLVRLAIYQDQTDYARARAHRCAAAILDADGADVMAVAAHLLLSRPDGDPWVARQLRQAAARALGSGDPGTAQIFLERALSEPPARQEKADTLIALADARSASGAEDATQPLQQALELIGDRDRRAEALYHLGALMLARFDLPGAAQCAQRGYAEVRRGPLADALEGILLASAAMVPELHDLAAGRIAQLTSSTLAGDDPSDPVTLAVVALNMVCRAADPSVALRLVHQAFARSGDRPSARAATINYLGPTLVYSEDLEQCERALTDAAGAADRSGQVVTAAFARVHLAMARLRCGRLGAARADAEPALALRHFGWSLNLGPALAVQIEAALEQGDDAAARAAMTLGEQTTDVSRQPLLLRARSRLLLATGDAVGAISAIETARQHLWNTHRLDNPVVVPWRTELARALARQGEVERAASLALDEAALAQSLDSARAQGIALATAGTLARDVDLLARAVALLETTSAALERARALLELGATLRRTRHRADAREPLRRALALSDTLGAKPLAQRARDELAATGAHPRRVALEGVDSLTPTERRIAELASSGMSNRAIAETLVVTPKTVEWHLSRVYSKLGVRGRDKLSAILPAAMNTP